jgi:hypothetical protein
MAELMAEEGGTHEHDDEEEDDSDDDESDDESDEKEENYYTQVGKAARATQRTPASKAANGVVKAKDGAKRLKDASHLKKAKKAQAKDDTGKGGEEGDEDADADPSTRATAVTLARRQQEKIEREKQKQKLNGAGESGKRGTCTTLHVYTFCFAHQFILCSSAIPQFSGVHS